MEINNIYLGDCLEVMTSIPDQSIDMILCDLPYGTSANKEDIIIPFIPLWEQYERIIKENGVIALFGQGLFYVDLVNSNRKLFRYDLVWDKKLVSGFLNAKKQPLRQHEQIAIFYKKPPVYNPQFTEGEPLHSIGKRKEGDEVVNNNYGSMVSNSDHRRGSTQKYPKSILSFQKPHPSVSLHRTEKPVKLCEYLIRTYTNEGDTVLDNCIGSGTTAIACMNTKRNYIGIEKDEKYFKICLERIKDHGRK